MAMDIDAKTALKRLRKGDVIHKELQDGMEAWWFENPYETVPAEVAITLGVKVGKRYRLAPAGDGLFGAETSQSWRAERTRRYGQTPEEER